MITPSLFTSTMNPSGNSALHRGHHDAVSHGRARDLDHVAEAAKRAVSPEPTSAVAAMEESSFADAARKMVKGAFWSSPGLMDTL